MADTVMEVSTDENDYSDAMLDDIMSDYTNHNHTNNDTDDDHTNKDTNKDKDDNHTNDDKDTADTSSNIAPAPPRQTTNRRTNVNNNDVLSALPRKFRKNLHRLPPEVREKIEHIKNMTPDQIEQAGGIQQIMQTGNRIAQRAVHQNIRQMDQVRDFVQQDRNRQEIQDSGMRIIEKNERGEQRCAKCEKILPDRVNKCPRCQKIFYCNSTCRKADYKKHKKQCKI